MSAAGMCRRGGPRLVPGTVVVLFLASLYLSGAVGVSSADGSIVDPVEFSPPAFVPGEVVTAYVRLDPGAARWSEASQVSGFSDAGEDGPSVLSAALESRKGAPLLVVRFSAWRAGPGFLPEFSIGGLDIPRLRFECGSALAAGDLRAPEALPQLDYPGLYTRLYLIGGALLVSVVVGLAAVAKAIPWLRALRSRWAFTRARKEFDELLDRLAAGGQGPAAWAELCHGVRRFSGLRAGLDLGAMTASEVLALPEGAIPGDVGLDVAALLAAGDAVRFAGNRDRQLGGSVEQARLIAARIDEAVVAAAAARRQARVPDSRPRERKPS